MHTNIKNEYKKYVDSRLCGKHDVISSFFLVYPFLKSKKVLDIGCSDGLYLKLFSSESVGIEQMSELVDKARQSGLNVIKGNIMEILPQIPDNTFDAVFFSHVMEHLDSPILSLREINRILVNDGHLILGLPTENNLFRFVLRKDYFDGTHIYAFSVRNAKKLLKVTGFDILKVYYDLPKCKGKIGEFIIRIYQHFPFKEHISMAYWIVSRKA